MNPSEQFIRRPVATVLIAAALGLAGAVAYGFLPVGPLPQVDFPSISVAAALPGANPETMASSVATPLERQFGRIAGINEMTSSSFLGVTSITLQFELNRNIDAAARDVQAAINAARGQLPPNLPQNPSWKKVNPADTPIVFIALTSDTMRLGEMYDAAASILQQRLSQLKGVGQVLIVGGSAPAVRIDVNPSLLSRIGLGFEDVRAFLASASANRPKGSFSDAARTFSIAGNDQLSKAADYEPLVVAYKHGAPVKLSDFANVSDSVEDLRIAGLANGRSALILLVFRQPRANVVETCDLIRAALPALQASVPPAMHIEVLLDSTTYVRASLRDVQVTMCISIALVIAVVFLFLRRVRTTLIPAVAVPLSLVATFGVLYLFGYSVDNLSLMALTIATGFVVDDAIVVIENITRYVESGLSPMEASIRGSREIGFTVFSISVSLIAVFLPILMMGGFVGRLFREFAIALSAAILISLFISLTLTPMMCARIPEAKKESEQRVVRFLVDLYARSLTRVLRHQAITFAVTLATIGFTVYLYVIIPKGFFPQQDVGTITGQLQADQSTSFQAMQQRVMQVSEIIRQDPAVENVVAFQGGGGGGGINIGRMFITLHPLAKRKISADQVIARLRPPLSRVAGVSVFLQAIQALRIGTRIVGAQYQYTLQSQSVSELNEWAPRVYRKLRTLPELADVNTDQQDKGLQASLVIDRATASRVGITTQRIDDTLYDAFGQRQVSTFYTQFNQYHVILEAEPQFWQSPQTLKSIYVNGTSGQVPLSAFTRYEPDRAPLAVNHQGLFPSVTISFNLPPGTALGQAVPIIEEAERQMGVPSTIHGSFSGTAQAYQESLATEPVLIAAALVAVYIVLGMLYESLIHPITILSTLPSAGVGALLALLATHNELNVISFIGIILLIGIVKKNAIMMIDFALEAERNGLDPENAIYEACLLRFRPITMTTVAALLGGLPLALGTGVGAELRRPLGIAIVGGLIFSQLLTLYTTPVMYLYMDRLRKREAMIPSAQPQESEVLVSS
jgi:multidrug efflux pump